MPRRPSWNTDDVSRLAERGGGVIARRDLLALGVPTWAIDARTRPGGPWQVLLPATYLTRPGPPSRRERVLAALAYAGTEAMLTGMGACSLWGLGSVLPGDDVHLLVPHERRIREHSFVSLERSRQLPSPVLISGFPCAPVSRAVVDGCRRLTDSRAVTALVAESVQRGKCSARSLMVELESCQQKGTARVRTAVLDALAGVRSVAESEGRVLVRRAGLPEPLWNVDVRSPDGTFLARPDGWWPDLAAAWQIDSREYHTSPEDWASTLRRHAALASRGVLVLHTLPSDIRKEPATVVEQLRSLLAAAAQRPAPRLLWRAAA